MFNKQQYDKARYASIAERKRFQAREWRRLNPEKKRINNHCRVAKRRGMTLEQYNVLLGQQEGLCAICAKPPNKYRLAIDHNHITGANRGLLCEQCNMALAILESCPDWTDKALAYLGRWK